jgi:hypothetical protein
MPHASLDRAGVARFASSQWKFGADVGTSLAAGLADEPGFQIGQPDIIRPSVAADRGPMAALVIRAIDQSGGPRTPAARISAKVIFCWAMAHQSAGRVGWQIVLRLGPPRVGLPCAICPNDLHAGAHNDGEQAEISKNYLPRLKRLFRCINLSGDYVECAACWNNKRHAMSKEDADADQV